MLGKSDKSHDNNLSLNPVIFTNERNLLTICSSAKMDQQIGKRGRIRLGDKAPNADGSYIKKGLT